MTTQVRMHVHTSRHVTQPHAAKDELHSTVMEYQRGMRALGLVRSSCVASLTLARLLFEASCGVGLQARLCGADIRQSRAMSRMNCFSLVSTSFVAFIALSMAGCWRMQRPACTSTARCVLVFTRITSALAKLLLAATRGNRRRRAAASSLQRALACSEQNYVAGSRRDKRHSPERSTSSRPFKESSSTLSLAMRSSSDLKSAPSLATAAAASCSSCCAACTVCGMSHASAGPNT